MIGELFLLFACCSRTKDESSTHRREELHLPNCSASFSTAKDNKGNGNQYELLEMSP
jgi:hypothetical protein